MKSLTFLILQLLAALAIGSPVAPKPLKVFILAGQSNMEGPALVRTFDYIGDDPATAPLLKLMRAPDGQATVCEKVWISYLTGQPYGDVEFGEGFGKLTAGYGAREKPGLPGEKIGPELTFGITMSNTVKEPILIIKAAWGGKSLNTDFRPPSAGPYDVVGKKRLATPEQKQKKIAETGVYYREMIKHTRMVLKDIKRVYPNYDEKRGYEIAGFVWFQGWNDMTDHDTYPTPPGQKVPDYSLYTEWLGEFIHDVRTDLQAPRMPFVIGVLGCDGLSASESTKAFRRAMSRTADAPEFKGNVVAVETAPFWDERLGAIDIKHQKVRQYASTLNKKVKSGEMTQEAANEEVKTFWAGILSPEEDALWNRGACDGNYHYLGCAKTFAQIGRAFADALNGLMKQRQK